MVHRSLLRWSSVDSDAPISSDLLTECSTGNHQRTLFGTAKVLIADDVDIFMLLEMSQTLAITLFYVLCPFPIDWVCIFKGLRQIVGISSEKTNVHGSAKM